MHGIGDILLGLPANIISGLLGALGVGIITLAVQFWNEWRVRKAYPLHGQYLTTYEDLNNKGERISRKAIADVKQKGIRLTGLTTNLDDNRTWNIEMSVDEKKKNYILGTYSGVDPTDDSRGVIFLHIQGKHFEGLWAGYDPLTKSIQTGSYKFKRTPEIVDLKEEYMKSSLAILGDALGDKYFTEKDLTPFHTADNKKGFVAVDEFQEVAGVCLCNILDKGDIPALLNKNEIADVMAILPELEYHTWGFLKSVAVKGKFRNQGIGYMLTEKTIGWMCKEKKATSVFAIAWESNGECFIQNILNSIGFERKKKIEKFWHDDSLKRGYSCPKCGDPPCECDAVIFTKKC